MIGAAGACYTMSALLAPKRATSCYVMYVPCPAGGPIAPAGCSANALGHRVCGDQEHLGEASNSVIASHTILFVTNLGDVPQNLAKVHSTLDLGETAVFVELCLPIFCPIPSILGFSGTLVSATEHPGHLFPPATRKKAACFLLRFLINFQIMQVKNSKAPSILNARLDHKFQFYRRQFNARTTTHTDRTVFNRPKKQTNTYIDIIE